MILAKDHDADTEASIFHNDIRAYGKDFERFYQRAANLPGVEFVRSYVEVGREIAGHEERHHPLRDGRRRREGGGVRPGRAGRRARPARRARRAWPSSSASSSTHTASARPNPVNPIETTRPGIFVSGAFQGPMDIPESVMSASGASALAGELLRSRRGKLATERVYPEERDVSEEEVARRRLRLPLRRQHRPRRRHPLAGGVLRRPLDTSRTRRRGSSSAPRTRRRRSRRPSARRGSTAWSWPPAPPAPTSRSSATRCARAGSTSTSSTWPTSGSTAPGCTPSRRRRRPRRRRTSCACPWPAPLGLEPLEEFRAARQQGGARGRRRRGRDDAARWPWPTRGSRSTSWRRRRSWAAWRGGSAPRSKAWTSRPG